jgi:hypothetical protein
MNPSVAQPNSIPPEVAADDQAVLDHVLSGRRLDPEIARRVHERARTIRQEILQKHGVINVAVDLIREIRDPCLR